MFPLLTDSPINLWNSIPSCDLSISLIKLLREELNEFQSTLLTIPSSVLDSTSNNFSTSFCSDVVVSAVVASVSVSDCNIVSSFFILYWSNHSYFF